MKFNRFYLINPLFALPILRVFNTWIHASAAHYFVAFMTWITFGIAVLIWPQLVELMPWHKLGDAKDLELGAPDGTEYHQK